VTVPELPAEPLLAALPEPPPLEQAAAAITAVAAQAAAASLFLDELISEPPPRWGRMAVASHLCEQVSVPECMLLI
jgi:hypothetical protein